MGYSALRDAVRVGPLRKVSGAQERAAARYAARGDSMRSVRLLRKRLAGRRKRRRRANYRRGGTGLDGPGGTGYGCHECKAALLVNPYDPDSVAAAIGQALSMPLAERRERHDALFRVLSHNDIQHWADRFLAALVREPTALSQLEQMHFRGIVMSS